MKSYNDFEKVYIGASDISSLVAFGLDESGLKSQVISFGEDGAYSAYVVDEPAEIGSHYTNAASFIGWCKIYDDFGLVKIFRGSKIKIYRAGVISEKDYIKVNEIGKKAKNKYLAKK